MTNLLAPIKWGGQVGLFTPLVGVGKAVILSHFIHEFVTRYRGQVVLVGIEDENHPAEDLRLGWREWGVEGKIKLIFEQTDDFLGLAKKAGKTAETCLGRGTQVLLLVDGDRLPLVEAIQTSLSLPGDEKLTSLYYGSYSMGALPESLCTLDAVITFDGARAKQGLWPAIDPLRSTAKTESFTKAHAELADRARRLLARYQDLHDMVETLGLDGLKKPADRIDAERARKLHRYFTQPLPRAEPWTGVPGQIVSLDDTLADCAAILDGKYDDIPEDEFRFIGRINR